MITTMCCYYLVTLDILRLMPRYSLHFLSILYDLWKSALLENNLLTNFLLFLELALMSEIWSRLFLKLIVITKSYLNLIFSLL